ncbi:MAG: hypothetical protein Q8K22_10465 [Rhodoferax sp.]|nr:hypothetical protein [Rhodoferax sp.]
MGLIRPSRPLRWNTFYPNISEGYRRSMDAAKYFVCKVVKHAPIFPPAALALAEQTRNLRYLLGLNIELL